jgi:two-component system sensor kinase FixL
MNGPFITTLYVIVGIIGFAALNHGLAFVNKRASRVHRIFALMAIVIMAHVICRISAYHAQTVSELVLFRRWEIVFTCFFAALFVVFISEYTGFRPRKFIRAMIGFWAVLLIVHLFLPYGIQFVEAPQLSYLDLPWGEQVVDIRVLKRSIWHKLGYTSLMVIFCYALYASYVQYTTGNRKRARGLGIAVSVFFIFLILNGIINSADIRWPHTSDFGFVALVILMDIELTNEFRDQNRRLSDLLNYFPFAIGIKDIHGRYQYANPEFLNYFGVKENDISGKTDVDLFSQELASYFQEIEAEVIADGKNMVDEYSYQLKGKPSIVRLRHFSMKRSDGTVFGSCCIHNDVTEQKEKEASLQKLRRQVWHSDRIASASAITSSIAHEICQPLSAILNNAQAGLRFLTANPVDLDEIRELLQDIVRDDKRAGGVINGLRTLLQKQEVPRASLDLNLCIHEVLEILHAELIRVGVEVESRLEQVEAIFANKVQIQQVLINLIMNALESMSTQGVEQRVLSIHSELIDGKSVLVSIRDTGIGIHEDKLEKVFEGFYTTKSRGMGVGLEVCRSIIESHSGKIWVEANTDAGVTFSFVLPLHSHN